MTGTNGAPDGPAPAPAGRGRAPGPSGTRPTPAWLHPDLLLAIGVLALAVFFFVGALQIRVSPAYEHIGPRFFPFLVSTGLAACGLGLLAGALRRAGVADGPAAPAAPGEPAPLADWRSVAITVAALLAQILLLERAGFIISSTILFAGVAWAFGSRRHGRDVVIGFILAFVVYWSFTQWLGLRLPAGILRPVLVWLGGS